MNDRYLSRLNRIVADTGGLKLEMDYPLSRLTSVGTGGVARLFAAVDKVGALCELVRILEKPFFIMGSGTNLLLSDRAFEGTIVRLGNSFGRIREQGRVISAGAAASLGRLVHKAVEQGFPGFEELAGVPGSVGGAASMNAGTHIVELGDLLEKLMIVDMDGQRRVFARSELVPGYRCSLAPVPGVITSLSFRKGENGNPASQRERARELSEGRRLKHPWRARTFGSTFKNPPGQIAAKLIDRAGLKGTVIGGARISPVHANFIENHNGASSLDIVELIKLVRERVSQDSGITLEPEVRLVGFTGEELGELASLAVNAINKKND